MLFFAVGLSLALLYIIPNDFVGRAYTRLIKRSYVSQITAQLAQAEVVGEYALVNLRSQLNDLQTIDPNFNFLGFMEGVEDIVKQVYVSWENSGLSTGGTLTFYAKSMQSITLDRHVQVVIRCFYAVSSITSPNYNLWEKSSDLKLPKAPVESWEILQTQIGVPSLALANMPKNAICNDFLLTRDALQSTSIKQETCPYCNAPLQLLFNYCSFCGARVGLNMSGWEVQKITQKPLLYSLFSATASQGGVLKTGELPPCNNFDMAGE